MDTLQNLLTSSIRDPVSSYRANLGSQQVQTNNTFTHDGAPNFTFGGCFFIKGVFWNRSAFIKLKEKAPPLAPKTPEVGEPTFMSKREKNNGDDFPLEAREVGFQKHLASTSSTNKLNFKSCFILYISKLKVLRYLVCMQIFLRGWQYQCMFYVNIFSMKRDISNSATHVFECYVIWCGFKNKSKKKHVF